MAEYFSLSNLFCVKCGKKLKVGQKVVILKEGLCHPECESLVKPCDVCGAPAVGAVRGHAGSIYHYCDGTCKGHLVLADDSLSMGRRAAIKEARRTAFGGGKFGGGK